MNYFWKDVLNAEGRWSDVSTLEERFGKLAKDEPIIVYCGSGVSACPNVIALEEAGYSNVKLYSGSWSDWISYEENAVATGTVYDKEPVLRTGSLSFKMILLNYHCMIRTIAGDIHSQQKANLDI